MNSMVTVTTLHEFDMLGAKCLLRPGEVEPYTLMATTSMVLLTIAAADASSAVMCRTCQSHSPQSWTSPS